MNKIHRNILACCALMEALSFTACKKDVTPYSPGEGKTASLAFYGASQTFTAYGNKGGVGIFIDTAPFGDATIGDFLPDVPYFSFTKEQNVAYPFVINQPDAVLYEGFKSGDHKVSFAYLQGAMVQTLKDTSFELAPDSRNILYLTDAPAAEGADAVYQTVLVPEPAAGGANMDKVNVKLVHLSADAGTVRASMVRADNQSELFAGLPQQLAFGSYSDYIPLDTAGTIRDGQLVLHIYKQGSATPILVGIPAQLGHGFEVLLTGMAEPHSRRLATGTDTDGNPQYQQVTLPVGLNTVVRQMY